MRAEPFWLAAVSWCGLRPSLSGRPSLGRRQEVLERNVQQRGSALREGLSAVRHDGIHMQASAAMATAGSENFFKAHHERGGLR